MAGQQNKGILVVGGAGYIGSHMVRHLKNEGYEPVVLDNLSTGHEKSVGTTPFYKGNASDSPLVSKILKKHGIFAVMHFSAKALVGESVKDPLLYYDANVSETVSLLKTLMSEGVKNFVFSSTCATYGVPEVIPIAEGLKQNPVNPYGKSKLMVEQVLKDLSQAYGFSSAVLRYFNASGADPKGDIGEDHDPETHLLPIVIKTALGQRSDMMIYGKDYPTPDGTCIRDYIHVNDLASGHILALEYILKNPGYFDVNLGTGQGYSNIEVIHTVEKLTGRKVNYSYGERRPGDPPSLVADPKKAFSVLKWKPKYDLNAIAETAIQWHEKNPKGFKS